MFLERLLNSDSAPVLEQMVKFTSARHTLLLNNIANVDTPGYRQQDLSVEKFQALLHDRIESRGAGNSAAFDDINSELENPTAGILFHDGNNRSMEQLTADFAKNGLMHNMAIELLRKQFQQLEMALRERVS